MKGRMQAMLVASSLAVLSLMVAPVSIVSSAAVALVTLRRGAQEGLYVLLFSCLSAAALGMLLIGNVQFALLYGLVLWAPIWLISIVLRAGSNLSFAVEVSVFMGMAGVIGFYLFTDDPSAFWYELLYGAFAQPLIDTAPADVPVNEIIDTLRKFSHFMTGAVAAGGVFSMLFGLFLARWWQAMLYNPGGFRKEYLALRASRSLSGMSVAIVAAAWFMSGSWAELLWNLAELLAVLFSFVGVGIIHASFAPMKAGRYLIPAFYLSLFMIPHMVAVIIVVGLVDAWLDVRRKNLVEP